MANEYATLATLKLALGLGTDETRDDLLNYALSAASRAIDRTCGRRFYVDSTVSARVYRTKGRTISDPDGERLLIDDVSTATGLVVEIGTAGSSTYTAETGYEVGPENALILGQPITWLQLTAGYWSASTLARVQVTAKWGWPAVPDEIVQATIIQAARLFKRRESPEGVTGSAEWGTIRLSRVDPDVRALIAPYVIHGIA